MKTKYIVNLTLLTLGLILSWPLLAQDSGRSLDWRDIPLRDVITGETFMISDFKGKPILLESFAVWCPTCKRQQQQIQQLHRSIGNGAISISLDVDPNEDEAMVREHAARNGFDWLYAVAPPRPTRALIEEFGTAIVAAPSAPIVLICEDQRARLLRRGVNRADSLKAEIDLGCSR